MVARPIDKQGWLVTARCVPSPNYNKRPLHSEISLLVIHNISLPPGNFGGPHVEQFFLNQLNPSEHPYFTEISGREVSAHLFIDRQGGIVQFVSFADRAWHAGDSSYEGCENCNDYSIGIELEGTDDTAYTAAQYRALVEVTRLLMSEYPKLTRDRIAGHCSVAPGRKTDPGEAFDWQRYWARL